MDNLAETENYIQIPENERQRINWYMRNCYLKYNDKTQKYRWQHMRPARMLELIRIWCPHLTAQNQEEADSIKMLILSGCNY